MNNQHLDMDTKPWYKQFWPWFIIFFPASAVIAGITTVIIAFKNADSLVVDDYYKQGKAINQRTELLRAAHVLGYQAKLQRLEGNFLNLTFLLTQPEQLELTLDFVHPTDSEKDFTLTLKRQKEGNYQGLSPNSTAGRWYIRLSAPDQWTIKSELPASTNTIELIPTKFK